VLLRAFYSTRTPPPPSLDAEISFSSLRYSAATGGNMLGEFTLEEDSAERASSELVAPGALTPTSGSSERRDFPSK
jgi:hypothetical protein